ncbi:MAG: phospholipid carrier-dependent glycosyltransferase, partial [Candidatus Acidiferrum sp.]
MSENHRNSPSVILESDLNFSRLNGPDTRALVLDAAQAASKETVSKRPILRHPVAVAIIFGLAALALLLPGIGRPSTMFFDEPYFVPEARAFVTGTPNPTPFAPPLSKPPLGKLIIAAGMEFAGDNAFGWRITSGLCGALTVSAVYLWTYLLLEDTGLALLAAGLALFNNFLFVMSRIATPDVFLMFFLMWSLVAYTAALTLDVGVGVRRLLFGLSGVLVGLAGACKWNAIDTLAVFFLVTFVLLWISRRLGTDSAQPLAAYARNVEQIGVPALLTGLLFAPILSYSLAFWPLCRLIHQPFNFHQLEAMNVFMWHFNLTTVVNPAIVSPWYAWPLNLSPQRVLSYLVGNPIITYGG